MNPRRPKIAVVGSLNVDFTFRVPRIPSPGETLTARGLAVHLGGKGANQAIAAARAGAQVSLIGCVGNDEHGRRYREHLEKEGIQTDFLFTSEQPTGSAFIAVDDCGENSIVVNPGANAHLNIEHVTRFAAVFREVDAVVLQLECPLPVVARATELAKVAGVRVIVNPSPFLLEAVQPLRGADVWILNQSEFDQLNEAVAGGPVGEDVLGMLGGTMLVVTNGAAPTVLTTERERIVVLPPNVRSVDTVGAGDTFAGAFAVALSESMSLQECVHFANVAGALATLREGAQASIPDRKSVDRVIREENVSPVFLCLEGRQKGRIDA
jgi:ribokinase